MKCISFLFLLLFSFGVAQSGQTETQAKLVVGSSAFLDEDTPFDHFVIGGSMRFYLSERLSVEPEFLYMRGPGSDRDYVLTGNIAYDVVRAEKTLLYLIGGAGILHHTEKFPGAVEQNFSSSEWTAAGGVGAQINISRSVFITSEFRAGWEPLYRLSAGIGFAFDTQ